MNFKSIESLVNRCTRAVSNIRNNEERYASPDKTLDRVVAVPQPFPVYFIEKHDSIDDLGIMEQETAFAYMRTEAEARLMESASIVQRGYFATHRMIGHLLPTQFRWTVAGVDIVNRILAESAVTSAAFVTWSKEIENHKAEMKKNENERIAKQIQYSRENADQCAILCDELIRMLRERDERTRNYGKLFNHLRTGLGSGFRGSRGVRVIHEAMLSKLKWATHWAGWMHADMENASKRDIEAKAQRRARNNERKNKSTDTDGDSPDARLDQMNHTHAYADAVNSAASQAGTLKQMRENAVNEH